MRKTKKARKVPTGCRFFSPPSSRRIAQHHFGCQAILLPIKICSRPDIAGPQYGAPICGAGNISSIEQLHAAWSVLEARTDGWCAVFRFSPKGLRNKKRTNTAMGLVQGYKKSSHCKVCFLMYFKYIMNLTPCQPKQFIFFHFRQSFDKSLKFKHFFDYSFDRFGNACYYWI